MNSIIKNIISFSLKHKSFTFFWVGTLAIAGFISFKNMSIDAFPDVTNTQIIIITQWAGKSAEEIERFVTTPIEIAMNAVQKKTSVRSVTMFGLSSIKIIFEDDIDDLYARQQVNNQLKGINLPDNVEPEVQPPYGPTGEIFRYVLQSKDRNSRNLLTYQNWVVDRNIRSVPGVADIVTFGGKTQVYEIGIDPIRLDQYKITPNQLFEAISKSNVNVGGDVIEKNGQNYVVRGIGLLNSIQDIENIIVKIAGTNPIIVKNIASVAVSSIPRVGQAGLNNQDDVVEGIVVMRKGENPQLVLKNLKLKIKELNEHILPKDIKIETFYDRDNLMNYTTKTVMHNLIEGIIFVTVIVFLFMADWRTTITVAIIIPLSLLFSFFCLNLKGMGANLLSLGAVDFGIIIDGSVVMVEGIFVTLDAISKSKGIEYFNNLAIGKIIKKNGVQLGKAIFFSKLIIITALIPIFSFQKVEGKMFSPLAYTLGFALLGALIFTLTLVPVLCHLLLNKNVKEKHNLFVNFWNKLVENVFIFTWKNKFLALSTSLGLVIIVFISSFFLGTEFLPQINEGSLWITAELPISYSQIESIKIAKILREEIQKFTEVKQVLSQEGRSNDGTDPNGFNFLQFQVDLKPKEELNKSLDEIIAIINNKLSQYQGITFNYSQPIVDNVAEAAAGIKASNAIKIYGNDLQILNDLAIESINKIQHIKGVEDVGVLRNLGQPEISVILNRKKMASLGVQIEDAESVLEMAFGGKTATQKFEDEKKFDIRVRYAKEFRTNENDIKNLKVQTINGFTIPLKEICSIKANTGPAFIYRDNMKRFIGIKFSVRNRDLGSAIKEAQDSINNSLKLPIGYSIDWTGEFENQVRASKRLGQVIPISLIAIFILLFITFGNIKDALLVLCNVPFAVIGGILALHLTQVNFGISAGVGFIALLGICIQNGVILISEFHTNQQNGLAFEQALLISVKQRTRAIIMTALMASIGLLPAAISTGIGSESQKPLAIVIIGGLMTATVLTLFIFPIIYWLFNKKYTKK